MIPKVKFHRPAPLLAGKGKSILKRQRFLRNESHRSAFNVDTIQVRGFAHLHARKA
ncbi:Unknown protein sequence [Pseudomonas amygdali pv. lachrymans]|uniref:Uncharacterized protein n=1 Tax=Pseudomonas amygdali pv. lachrymans TaxID=53707 RepID=A0ABR5KRV7_PSEAV|nr:Unknown protein sequence [Pseudomonas amygdali pv. lachrymans]